MVRVSVDLNKTFLKIEYWNKYILVRVYGWLEYDTLKIYLTNVFAFIIFSCGALIWCSRIRKHVFQFCILQAYFWLPNWIAFCIFKAIFHCFIYVLILLRFPVHGLICAPEFLACSLCCNEQIWAAVHLPRVSNVRTAVLCLFRRLPQPAHRSNCCHPCVWVIPSLLRSAPQGYWMCFPLLLAGFPSVKIPTLLLLIHLDPPPLWKIKPIPFHLPSPTVDSLPLLTQIWVWHLKLVRHLQPRFFLCCEFVFFCTWTTSSAYENLIMRSSYCTMWSWKTELDFWIAVNQF